MRLRGQNLHLPPDRAAKPIPGVLDMSVTRGFSHSLGPKRRSTEVSYSAAVRGYADIWRTGRDHRF